MAAEPAGPWAFADPRRDHSAIPYTDEHTLVLVEQTVESLVLLRSPLQLGDAGATITALVSLAIEIESQLHHAVADAKDQDYSWDAIAHRLATSATTARRRYAHARRTPLDLD